MRFDCEFNKNTQQWNVICSQWIKRSDTVEDHLMWSKEFKSDDFPGLLAWVNDKIAFKSN